MVKSRFFLRTILLTTFSILISLLLGSFASFWLNEQYLESDNSFKPPRGGPFAYHLQRISKLSPSERADAIANMPQRQRRGKKMTFLLADAEGRVIAPSSQKGERVDISRSDRSDHRRKPGHPMWRILFGPPGPMVFKLDGEPTQYLAMKIQHKGRSEFQTHFLRTFGILAGSVFFGIVLSTALIFLSLRRKSLEMEQVILELKKGNLKARMPIDVPDEMTKVMSKFNEMANEIENLVNYLKESEAERRSFFREISHDLRTPIASMKNLLETLQAPADKLSHENREKCMKLAVKETEYIEALVENLLFLGEVSEPRYKEEAESLSVKELMESELTGVEAHYLDIKTVRPHSKEDIEIFGDRRLFERMIRNVLENAYSFANSQVTIHLECVDNNLLIVVEDDGPGFEDSALRSYGQRKSQRRVSEASNNRISIGLGSVIVRSVAERYRGAVKVENLLSPEGNVVGAKVTLSIPIH